MREEYLPRVRSGDDGEEEEEEEAMPKTERGRRVVKDKYIKGEYIGKSITYEKEALSHDEQLCKGL